MRRPQGATVTYYASILRACAQTKSLSNGKLIHKHVLHEGLSDNLLLSNLLVQMYGRCNSLSHARATFDAISNRNVFSWTIMITAYTHNAYYKEALHLHQDMEREGTCKPGAFALSSVLDACSAVRDLERGSRVHARIVNDGVEMSVVLETALLKMYASCGCMELAERIFQEMSERDVVSWNAMITAYAQEGHYIKVFELYWSLFLDAGVAPNQLTFAGVLSACSSMAQGERVVQQVISCGFEPNVIVKVSMIHMFSRFNQLTRARLAFDRMQAKNLVAWNAMLNAYVQRGMFHEALELSEQLDLEPDAFTFASVLGACSRLELGKQLHSRLVTAGLSSSVILQTALVIMYVRCGAIQEAKAVFEEMSERDLVAWNATIAAYAQGGHHAEAIGLYQRMVPEGVLPNSITFASVIGACSSLGDIEQGKVVHADAVARDLDKKLLVESALVNLYAKCGSLKEARSLFDRMQRRDVVSWNAMIAGYAQAGHCRKALGLYQLMEAEGSAQPDMFTFASVLAVCAGLGDLGIGELVRERMAWSGFHPDIYAQNALLIMYARCGGLEDARMVFDAIVEKDVISWNSMISACARHGQYKEAVQTFDRMETEPDDATFVSVLGAVSAMADLIEGTKIHERIAGTKFERMPNVESAVMSMHAKCGNVTVARRLFEKMEVKDLVSWNAVLAGYAQHGDGAEAVKLYQRMELDGVEPNGVTLAGVLASCIHLGLLDEGLSWFRSISLDRDLGLASEHYRCMVDMLGRCGRLEEAQALIQLMPFEPEPTIWMTLLSACKLHGHLELANWVAERLDPDDAASYVLLSNIYSTRHGSQPGARVTVTSGERDKPPKASP